jgi:PAS domain S-box-containing protein
VRANLPVTPVEYALPAGQTLVSVTDLKGRITYCNPAFIAVSGYSRDELMGQPHNIVRHPDMPEEAFRDLWHTIQSGLPWTGLVKNRRKNGDHYWVRANATPMKDGAASPATCRCAPCRHAPRCRLPTRCTPACATSRSGRSALALRAWPPGAARPGRPPARGPHARASAAA